MRSNRSFGGWGREEELICRRGRLLVVLLLLVPFVYVSPAEPSRASDQEGSVGKGKTLFESRCSSCHTIGGGRKVGPDLNEVTKTRSRDWLISFIEDPEKMFRENNPTATKLLHEFNGVKMPNLGLSKEQVLDVLAYIQTKETVAIKEPPAKEAAPTPAPSAVKESNPSMGEKLFAGRVSFQKDGPPCMWCHKANGISFPNGGTLGPDLTDIHSRFGRALTSILATLSFPVMQPIFHNHQLVKQEQLDLAAFFKKAPSEKKPFLTTLKFGLIALGGFLALLGLIWLTWHGGITSVRKELVHRSLGRKKG